MSTPEMPWFGRLGYDREGIVKEREFKTEAEAKAYAQGLQDAINESLCGDCSLEDYWTASSQEESIDE